jgi:hypothetical protein
VRSGLSRRRHAQDQRNDKDSPKDAYRSVAVHDYLRFFSADGGNEGRPLLPAFAIIFLPLFGNAQKEGKSAQDIWGERG